MIKTIKYQGLYQSELGWLQSRFHFSFSEYHNPQNMNFGVLRVMNDDLIQPHKGFGMHPHKNMEIISYVVKGELRHQDSMGNKKTLKRGEVQYMSAGTGIVHSEMNESNEQTRLLQIWIPPEKQGLTPSYGSKGFLKKERLNQWLHFVGPTSGKAPISIHQDVNFYVTELEKNQSLNFPLKQERQIYLKLIEGEAMINEASFKHGDAAEIWDENISIQTDSEAHVLIIEMPKNKG